jgi:hypothetical protein
MASQADPPTLPWPSAANPAAIAMPKPEAIATKFVPPAAPPCAYAGMVIIMMASSDKKIIITFRIFFSPYEMLPGGG